MSKRSMNENIMSKILKKMESEGISDEKGITDFMNNLVGKNIDELDFGAQTNEDKSLELLEEAYEAHTKTEARRLAKSALKLMPHNSDAYLFLSGIAPNEKECLRLLEKGYETAKTYLGTDCFIENKGHFWGMIETRPYMRIKLALAQEYFAQENIAEGVEHLKEMLDLNPNDNQGVRLNYSTILLREQDFVAFEDLLSKYPEDGSPEWLHNLLLFNLKTEKDIKVIKESIEEAKTSNPNILTFLMEGPEALAEGDLDLESDYITVGGKEEALFYVLDALDIWEDQLEKLNFLVTK